MLPMSERIKALESLAHDAVDEAVAKAERAASCEESLSGWEWEPIKQEADVAKRNAHAYIDRMADWLKSNAQVA